MAVSGTYNFNLDIDEVIQEAMEMIGGEDTLGHEPASARRSINLMLKDLQSGMTLFAGVEHPYYNVRTQEISRIVSDSLIQDLSK